MGVDRSRMTESTIIVLTLLILLIFTMQYDFPAFKYTGSPTEPAGELIKNNTAVIGLEVGRFLWNYRVIDLIAQAFVLFAAAVCCLALLKTEEKKG
jgi:amino acid transporter